MNRYPYRPRENRSRAAVNGVIPAFGPYPIVACTARDGIIIFARKDNVCALAAVDGIVAGLAVNQIIAITAVNPIIAGLPP